MPHAVTSNVSRGSSVPPVSRPSRRLLAVSILCALVGCSGNGAPDESTAPPAPPTAVAGPDDPAVAVTQLFAALASEDYQRAAELTVDDQMMAIAVAEDSSLVALQMVLEDGGNTVAANYWSGFSSNLDELLGVAPEDVGVGRVTEMDIDGREFARVELEVPVDRATRRFVVQRTNGWKVDVVATFAPTLAARLARAFESLQADAGATEVLETLAQQRPSLDAALRSGSIDADTAGVIRSAIETLGS